MAAAKKKPTKRKTSKKGKLPPGLAAFMAKKNAKKKKGKK